MAIDDRTMSGNEMLAQLLGTLDMLKDGVMVIDNDSRITYANAEMSRVLYDQDLAGKNISEARLGEYCPNFFKNFRIAHSEHKNISFIEYIQPLKMWYNVYIYPTPSFVSVIFKDRSVFERLNEQYKLTHYTIDNAQEYVLWVAMDGRLSYGNEPTRSKLGYTMATHDEYRIYDIIQAISPDNWHQFRKDVTNGGLKAFESAIFDAYGKRIMGEVTANYIKVKEREYIVIFIRDIGPRKLAENEMKSSKAQAELYLDLMCHDINNINQVGIGFLELAMETGDVKEPVSDYLDKAMESLHRSTDLITNVKKLQSSKTGSVQIRPMNLSDVIDEAVTQYSSHHDRDVDIRFERRGEFYVMANDLLKDVFDNLIGNAIKHSRGPLTIDIGIDKVREGARDFYRIDVEDNGPGIPDPAKDIVFSRGDVNKKRASGKGFGLYLVKTLVSDFKGGVWAEDRVPGDYKQGCRFVIMLPAIGAS